MVRLSVSGTYVPLRRASRPSPRRARGEGVFAGEAYVGGPLQLTPAGGTMTSFLTDAIWESPILGLRYENRASFLELLRATSTHDLLIQTAQCSVITLSGADQARATTTIHEFCRGLSETGEESNFEQY